MSDSLIEVGKITPRFTVSGKLSSYTVELRHNGLGEHREIKSSDLSILTNKVEAALVKWGEKWVAHLRRSALQATVESAASETEAAQSALRQCDELLTQTLNVDDRVAWDDLKPKTQFVWSQPAKPGLRYRKVSNEPIGIEPVERPRAPEEADFRPDIRWFHHLWPGLVAKKTEAAQQQFQAANEAYRRADEALSAEEQRRRALLESESRAFDSVEAEFVESRRLVFAEVDALRAAWSRKEESAVVEHTDLVLNHSTYPDWMKIDFSANYATSSGSLVVDYRLPAPDELPTLERVAFIKARNERTEKHIPESRQKKQYDSVCYQIALRTIHELFEADEVEALASITFNGWVEATNPSTGRVERNCILSVQAERAQFLALSLGNVDPKACFKALKGVAASSLIGLAPVRPILQLRTDDPRFVAPREIVDALDDSANLASMPWEDFEHLVRELFSKVFSTTGSEVHVTQASRDGGVDAIAFDPDPIKGGKIVIQAKRYTNVVGVSAVRDLYGTVMNEGANRGILVTTSDFGPDAYKFAQGKPLTLLNGGNLLSLLADHGHRARIDLHEAKLLQQSAP